jgi:YbbR domain-containing protein
VARGVENTYGNLPVRLLSVAADVRDYRVAPGTVAVTVSGPPNAMAVLQADQILAVVDLTGIESSHDLRRPVEVSVPIGMTLVRIEPQEVGVIVPPPPSDNKP